MASVATLAVPPRIGSLANLGPQLAREDLMSWLAAPPAFDVEIRAAASQAAERLEAALEEHVVARARREDLRRTSETLYRAYWPWAHTSFLADVVDVRRGEAAPGDVEPGPAALETIGFGIVSSSVRALWTVARRAASIGPRIDSFEEGTARTLALAAIAHAAPDPRPARRSLERTDDALARTLLAGLELGTERAAAAFVHEARTLVATRTGALATADVACAVVASSDLSWARHAEWRGRLASAIPWITRAAPEDLLLPRGAIERVAWTPGAAEHEQLAADLVAAMVSREGG